MTSKGNGRRLVVDLSARASAWALTADGAERLRESAPPGWDLLFVGAPTSSDGDGGAAPSDEARAAVSEAEAYFGYGMARTLFMSAPGLRWIHSASAGVGGLLFTEVRDSEVIVTNSAGVHAVPMAEYMLGGILYLLKSFDVAVEHQRSGIWDKSAFTGSGSTMRELRDCRVLIVGAGGIGSALATRLTMLGARCTGVRRHPERGVPAGFERVVGPDEWHDLLPATDVLVIAAPATSETKRMVTGEVLDRLPHAAILVNVARGSLVDEGALVERLRSGRVRGAVLDVFEEEPLPASSPLWGLPSVLLTPHVSAVSPHGFWERELSLFVDNWHRYVDGREMKNVVDKEAGY
ncbi:MAG TPA: D-2-hydroxyacid dehydrogenase [Gemmatimonadaceae bacterium]|nr:D-2-hydroxyacid dehydrogenase [Gemmatimonadaceae bacterium]